jgi:magnesium-transporting ATPase (P-type)
LLVVAFAAFFLGESPFSSVQLLWINLIMDTLAAFALGTEPPLPSVVAGQPYENMRVMQPQIWRQIYGMSLWNALVLISVVVFAPLTMDNMTYKMTNKPVSGTDDKANDNKLKHMTYMFHIFVFL